jgi:hypothetical protein
MILVMTNCPFLRASCHKGHVWETLARPNMLHVVDLCNACSDHCAIHQRKCKEWQKGGSLVALQMMKSLHVGTRR